MNRPLIALCTVALTVFPAVAADKSEGRQLAALSFEAVDRHGNGFVHQGDMEAMRRDIFNSMDANENNAIELPEFLDWGYGFQSIAEEESKELAYRTALKVVFSFWDRNGDGKITTTEHRKAIIRDFDRADLNDDAVLTEKEFVGGFSVLVAIRAALKPE